MRAILTKISGDFRHHPLPSVIIIIIMLLSVGVGSTAITILTESNAPFDQAFEQNHGAHLIITYTGQQTTIDQIQQTSHVSHVIATGGPWQTANIPFKCNTSKITLSIIGRDTPGGTVNQLVLMAGRWATAPGEIVLTRSFARYYNLAIGQTIQGLSRTDQPALRIVGEVFDINESDASLSITQYAWVIPAQISALLPDSLSANFMMAYRLDNGSSATIDTVNHQINATISPDAIKSFVSYLFIKQVDSLTSTVVLIFLLAFAIFALGVVAMVVANVVAGAVLASIRDIGITKALGFTPIQVVASFIGQMMIPALVGGVLGIPIGVLSSGLIINQNAESLGLPPITTIAILPSLLALVGALFIVLIAAGIPALRAAQLNVITAMRRNDVPLDIHHERLGRLIDRLRLPRAMSLGADETYAHPIRGILTTIIILTGICTLTCIAGLHNTLGNIVNDPGYIGLQDIVVDRFGTYPDQALMQNLEAQPGTENIWAFTTTESHLSSLQTPVITIPMRGDTAHYGYHMINGRWFNAPGEVVSGEAFAREANLHIGDTFKVQINHTSLELKLVGTYFDSIQFGRLIRMNWSDYIRTTPDAQPDTYYIKVHHGTDIQAFSRSVEKNAPDYLSVTPRASVSIFGIMDTVAMILAVILATVAMVGIFNTMLLMSRERARDIAILKALGMTPGQITGMVLSPAILLGIVGCILGIPLGIWLYHEIIYLSGRAINGTMPAQMTSSTYQPEIFPLLVIIGIGVALLGAIIPALQAAHQPAASVLQSE
jgi:putative ABC transport system permease protein